ncbi:Small ubiquitin-related modifier 2 [Striga hermonthica]|uniref:Small ubiquitin-related modifier 2 n=1 Tax=Striga hermonthica TaxID=68872 RepID=A0A9N7MNJ3_STRHE|nr:Small ubiquitin-related modifier 2 [Striga hermonthica]
MASAAQSGKGGHSRKTPSNSNPLKVNIYFKSQFLFEGKRVTAATTPSQLGIEDNDEIEVMMHGSGGGFCSPIDALNHYIGN